MSRRLLSLTLPVLLAAPLHAQDVAGLRARLEQAALTTAIDDDTAKPWHLVFDVEVLPTKTQKASHGTVEIWWQNRDQVRTQYTLPDYTATSLRNAAGSFFTRGQDSPPQYLEDLVDQIVHPLTVPPAESFATAEARHFNFGKVPLECLMLSKPLTPNKDSHFHMPPPAPLGLFPTYCFDHEGLRLTFSLGSQAVIRSAVGTFAKKSVSVKTVLLESGIPTASAHITTLRGGETPPPGTFDPTPDLVEPPTASHIAGGVLAGSILHKTVPQYPDSSKQNHVSGVVILHVVIGRDGHVHHLQLISAPDGDLALAAIDAVRTWVYKPYLLNGLPIEIDSTVTVNFTFGS